MLQERLNNCRSLISEVMQNRNQVTETENAAKRNNTFFDSYNSYFVPTVKSYAIAKNCTYISLSDELVQDLNEIIESTKTVFAQKSVVNAPKYQANYKSISEKFSKEWADKVAEYIGSIKEDMGIIRLVSNEKQEIIKIINCFNNFSVWPIDDSKVGLFESAYKRAEEIRSDMKFDDDIAAFLKKVKDREATILDLSDSIIAWIRQENLSENIMLNIRV